MFIKTVTNYVLDSHSHLDILIDSPCRNRSAHFEYCKIQKGRQKNLSDSKKKITNKRAFTQFETTVVDTAAKIGLNSIVYFLVSEYAIKDFLEPKVFETT